MGTNRNLWSLAASGLLLVALTAPRLPAEDLIKNSECLECHGDKTLTRTNDSGRVISIYMDAARLTASVHATNTCVSCHADLTRKHPDDNVPARPVNCAVCHKEQSVTYGASVHGLALRKGTLAAATCADCHDGHAVTRSSSPDSPLAAAHLAQTCGACHEREAKDVSESVHGQALAAGHLDAPSCTGCHSEHKIESLKATSSQSLSVDVCSKCHASERLNTKFKLPSDRVKTFFQSYHGLAAQYGSTLAANCGSCHGAHKILPSTDPASTIHKDHLVATCGKCHPGATTGFAQGKIHVDVGAASAGGAFGEQANWWVRRIYLFLIAGVIGAMLLHNGLLLFRKLAAIARRPGRVVVRMDFSQRLQHFVLAASFIVLALTGFALKFPDSWLGRVLFPSEPFRRWSHRIAGVVLLAVGAWHLGYLLFSPKGRRLVKDFLPTLKDLRDVLGNARYLLGLSSEKARIGRFGYAEKMEYWAVLWGTIIMGATGLMVWFKVDVTYYVPRWVVDVALTVHYYEAILACLAILVWHFYHVIFDPDVYPLNPACWDGRVSRHWVEEEHPLDQDALKQAEDGVDPELEPFTHEPAPVGRESG